METPTAPPFTPLRSYEGLARRLPVHLSPARLYARNTALAGLVLSRFPSLPWEAREDARGAALLALWAACQRYDGARGFTFSTFACGCIKNAVLNHLRQRRQQGQIPVVSLETPIGDGESDLADMLADTQAEKPGAALLDRAGFDALLAGLPSRQQAVLRAVYAEERPLSEIAEGMGVSKARAGQIHLQALAALRKRQE